MVEFAFCALRDCRTTPSPAISPTKWAFPEHGRPIVPATTDADRARIAVELGVADAWPVMTEPFRQWVIEDASGRVDRHGRNSASPWSRMCGPYEEMKLPPAQRSAFGHCLSRPAQRP